VLLILALEDEVVVLYRLDWTEGLRLMLLLLLLALPLLLCCCCCGCCSSRSTSGVGGFTGGDVTPLGPFTCLCADGGVDPGPLGYACIGLLLRSVEGVQSYVSSRVGLLSVETCELCPLSSPRWGVVLCF
jgi:hypothetical protein